MTTLTIESQRERYNAFVAQLEQSPEFLILDDLLSAIDNSAAEKAVDLIVSRTSAIVQPTELGNRVYNLACACVEHAYRKPPAQLSKLLDFLELIQQRRVEDPAGQVVKIHEDVLWTDMPTFGYTIEDELQSFSPDDANATIEEQRRRENFNGFVAAITGRRIPGLGYRTWAVTWCYQAFGPWKKDGPRATELTVRFACAWFIYAGELIWELIHEGQDNDGESCEWNRWKKCLVEYRQKFRGETKALIMDAIAEIEHIEQEFAH